ncbi:hypothetical protein KP509_22G037200 [Ceratopteris richardii]|uniref:SHSP domain-containing protein n=1 Tax=Ceratopteris richardii TaxID=49495 RepID=A0A8T2S7A7_CERRI|nr:hypothetical protein KP509_22G037200 [Ceratopteris richardii]
MVESDNNRIAVSYDIGGALRPAGALTGASRARRLRRQPHLFSRQLELPVGADSAVQVQESPFSFTFKVTLPPPLPRIDNIRAQVIHIAPDVTKVCVQGAQIATAHLDELDLPHWRIRLPASSIPEASTASCDSSGLLVLTIPKLESAQGDLPSIVRSLPIDPKNNIFCSSE